MKITLTQPKFARPNSSQFIEHLQFRNRHRRWNNAVPFAFSSQGLREGTNNNASQADYYNFVRASAANEIVKGVLYSYPVNTLRSQNGLLTEGASSNLFLNSASPVNQNIAVTAQRYALSFYGSGSINLNGAFTGTLNGTDAATRSELVFTPVAGSLTLAVTGEVIFPMFEVGYTPTTYIQSGASAVSRAIDNLRLNSTFFAKLFNEIRGYFICDFTLNKQGNVSRSIFKIADAGSTNFVLARVNASGTNFLVEGKANNGTTVSGMVPTGLAYPFQGRLGLKWGDGAASVSVNGATPTTIAISPATLTQAAIGSDFGAGTALNDKISAFWMGGTSLSDGVFQKACNPVNRPVEVIGSLS